MLKDSVASAHISGWSVEKLAYYLNWGFGSIDVLRYGLRNELGFLSLVANVGFWLDFGRISQQILGLKIVLKFQLYCIY
jgi:hypothetical protein